MNPLHQYDNSDYEAAIREHYRSLQVADLAQRETILDRWEKAPLPLPVAPPRSSRARIAAVVVVLLALITVSTLREFRTPVALYGADDLPARLVLVDSFRMTGWQYVANPGGVNLPSIIIPGELIVQRPGCYRHTFSVISDAGSNEQTIITGSQMCDGQYAAMLNDTSKEYLRHPVGQLDAMLKTEFFAQGYAMLMLLGPPDSSYERVGNEIVKGINCDLYVAHHGKSDAIRLWIDPQTGWPVRIVIEMLNAAGKWAPLIEFNEIEINGDLPDSLFTLTPPEGYVDQISKLIPGASSFPTTPAVEPPANQQLPELTMQSSGGGFCNDQGLEFWQSFLLGPDTALVVWKRSVPKPADNGAIDWLSGIDLDYQSGKTSRPLKHRWARPPQGKQWLWSIIKTADGQPFGRGMIQLTFHSEGCNLSNSIVPLLFPDGTLDRLIQAADKSLPVPASGEPLTLQSLRAVASELK